MSIHDSEPGDIYIDAQQKLWRVVGITREPTVIVEEVEGHTYAPQPTFQSQVSQANNAMAFPPSPPIIRDRRSGGVSGCMWFGFKRIWRDDQRKK